MESEDRMYGDRHISPPRTEDSHLTTKLTRRRLITLSGISTLGIITDPLFSPSAHAAHTLHDYVSMFTNAMAGSISRYGIDTYLHTVSNRISGDIKEINRMMIDGGFTNFAAARVYGFGDYFYYPVVNRDGFNVCMPFFSTRKPNSAYITMVEGPTLVGLALAARDYTARHNASLSRRVLLPASRIRNSIGSFKGGYVEPDEYITAEGNVRVDYASAGQGTGTIHVVSTKFDPRSLLLDSKYDISYLI